jgi:drug/metabolite transporter (DMT)-like permease
MRATAVPAVALLLAAVALALYVTGSSGLYREVMSRQALGNALAGLLFFIIAIVDFTRDSSGIGVVFLVFAAVFLGLAFSARKTASS